MLSVPPLSLELPPTWVSCKDLLFHVLRPYIDFEYFRQAHILKKENERTVMMYRSYRAEIPLPNRNYGLYAVQSLTIDLQKN